MRFSPFTFIASGYNSINIDYLIIGGGGGGGNIETGFLTNAGGGGAGQFISGSGSLVLNPDLSYPVVIGPGGSGVFNGRGNNGTASVFLNQSAIGGGGGGCKQSLNGADGASGGGATYFGSSTGVGGTGTAGFNGANAFYSATGPTYKSGCGGGAGGAATLATLVSGSIPGPTKAWLDGNQYAGGGNTGTPGDGPTYNLISGSGGTGNSSPISDVIAGRNGLVKVRYQGTTQLFLGGQVAISGGYVYHTFPTSGTLIPINQQ